MIEHAYIVVAFTYLLSGTAPNVSTKIIVKSDADNYQTYAAVVDCRKAKAKVMKNQKDVFYTDCVKIPKVDPGVQVLPPRSEMPTINTDEKWSVNVESKNSTSVIPWMGDTVITKSIYPQETELMCRKISELLERFGDKSRHQFDCSKVEVIRQQ